MPSLLDFFETRRPAAKRRKLSHEGSGSPTPSNSADVDGSDGSHSNFNLPVYAGRDIGAFDAGDISVGSEDDDVPGGSQTELEVSLPPVKTGQDAIEEYENSKAAGIEDEENISMQQRLGEMKWRKGKSSIYVDAFNLALETVLGEEAHLFDQAELDVFRRWNDLTYEAQYLLVALRSPLSATLENI
jgi:fanconi-associated nuclease 1